ncbi:MAG: GAF domain-containing protein [Anaerolineae bacterium]|nr:GAF domain-containing protein [Anaerolineae bacterium]
MSERSKPRMPVLTDVDLERIDPRVLHALESLTEIGAAINGLGVREGTGAAPRDRDQVKATLQLIAESALQVLPGASAVIYAYDQRAEAFDLGSRVSAGEAPVAVQAGTPGDAPRPDGFGMRAIRQGRRILSYEEADLGLHPAKAEAGAGAVACFPLLAAGQAVGALYVYLHQDRRFGRFELLLLGSFVNQAAMAIYQARQLATVQRDLERREGELARLGRAGLLISSRRGLRQTLDAILEMALEVTGAHYGIFRLLDRSGQNLVTHAVAGEHLARPMVEALPMGQPSVMGWVASHREAVCIADLLVAPWNEIYYPLDADLKMRSELAVPLIGANGRLEGVLNLESPEVGAFSEQDSLLLQSLATQAVISIQEVRLLDALQEVAQLLPVEPCADVLAHLVDAACDLLNAAASAIWTVHGDELVLQAASAGHRHGERLPLHGSLTGQAVVTGAPATTDDVQTDPRFHRPDLAHVQNWRRALIVPLHSSGDPGPIGAFSVYSTGREAGGFADSVWDEKVLTCLAHYAALAVHNAERQEALRTAQERQAVAETFAAIGDIAANVLHHLNNKVGTIPVRVQGIESKCAAALSSDAYLRANLWQIEQSAMEAMDTVRESLSHLRPIRRSAVDVRACAAAATAAAGLPEGVVVHVHGLEGLPRVLAGEQSLAFVFRNLFENAADAMDGAGVIEVDGRAEGRWVVVSVTDTGPGIAGELHDRIFEFDYTGRAAARCGKLGFGLWWVKTLMMRLGGAVTVHSDGVHGTTFRLRLPRAEEAA